MAKQARLDDMLWKNIKRIQSENSKEFYQHILNSRSEFLKLRLKQDLELKQIYIKSAERIANDIRNLPDSIGPLTRNHMSVLEQSLRREAEEISSRVESKFREGIAESVKIGMNPLQAYLGDVLSSPGLPFNAMQVQRGFGDVNTRAVEALWARTRHGMKLSERIWNLGNNAEQSIRKILLDAVATGRDAVKVAEDLQQYVKSGVGTLAEAYPNMMKRMGYRVPKKLSYEALRLARTEMTLAFQEGTYTAGAVNPAYKGVKWMLSASHPENDICNDYADSDLYGLGAGVYPKGEEPIVPHPNCLCFTVPIVEDKKEFIERLNSWLKNPNSQPDIQKWYRDFYQQLDVKAPLSRIDSFLANKPQAKTVEEATMWSENNVAEKALFTRTSKAEGLNDINTAIMEVNERFNLGKFNYMGDPSKINLKVSWKSNVVAMYARTANSKSEYFLFKTLATDESKVVDRMTKSDEFAANSRSIEELIQVLKDIEADPKVIEILEGRESNLWTISHTPKEVAYHEMGHRVYYNLDDDADDDNELLEAVSETKDKGWPTVLGEYARTNKQEYFAEAFSAYMQGKDDLVAPPILDWLRRHDKK